MSRRRPPNTAAQVPVTPVVEREAGALAPMLATLFCLSCLASIPYALTVSGPAMLVMAMVGVGSLVLARFLERPRWNRLVFWPVPLVLGIYVVVIAANGAPDASIRRSASMPFFSMLMLTVQIAAWRTGCLRAVLGGCGLVALAMSMDISWQWCFGRSLIRGVPAAASARLGGSQTNRNDMAAAALFMPLALGAWRTTSGGRAQLVLALVTTPVWILSRSRQVALGWTLGAVLPLVRNPSLRRSILSAVLALGVTAVVVLCIPAWRPRVVETLAQGLAERESIMALGVRFFVEHPLVGLGPGTFGEHYAAAVKSGWTWRGVAPPAVGMPWVHSIPIEIAAEFGVVGLAGFLLALGHAWRGALAMARGDDSLSGIGRGLVAALAAGMAMGLVDLSLIKDWFRIWFWVMLGLASLWRSGSGTDGRVV